MKEKDAKERVAYLRVRVSDEVTCSFRSRFLKVNGGYKLKEASNQVVC